MATRKPSVELFYDPADLDPAAPRLYIRKDRGTWELRDPAGELLGGYAKLPEAIDAAEELSTSRFHEILVRGAVSPMEWAVSQNPEMVELARALNETVPLEREAAD